MVEVRAGDRGMTAEIKITPEEGENIDVAYIKKMLQLEGVQAGIKEDAINRIVEGKIYDEYVLVAEGKEAVDGVNGYYKYFFVTAEENKYPRILEDGSVDYTAAITNVNVGDLVAEYHPATGGRYGYNVYATMIQPNKGEDARQHTCRNVKLENNKYYAEKNGFVTMEDNTLAIFDVLEINGDVNQNTGNIDFNGDVKVYGSILSNMVVKARGSIMVDNVIEGAIVKADKDIFVAKGIHGNGLANIEAEGNICATFIEYGFVNAGGDIKVDYAVGSTMDAKGRVIAEGRYATIMGGITSAVSGVEANILGNNAEVDTRVYTGITNKMRKEMEMLNIQLQQLRDESANIVDVGAFEQHMETMDKIRAKLTELEDKQQECKAAPIIVRDYINPGVRCYLNGSQAVDAVGKRNIEYRNIGYEVVGKKVGRFTPEEINSNKIVRTSGANAQTRPRILIVDDDPKMLHLVNEMLRDRYQVSSARGGALARKFLEKKKPDLILLDYMMPNENGAEVLRSLRKNDETKDIPVVFLTALGDRQKIMECLALKPAGYIAKPVDNKKLHDKIGAVLAISG